MTASLQVPTAEKRKIITLDYEGAHDIIDALEFLAHNAICIRNRGVDCPSFRHNSYSVEFDADRLTLYLTGFWAITLSRDGRLIVEGDDATLTVGNNFVLHTADGKVIEGEEVTWNGTEEIYTPSEFHKSVKEDVKTVLDLIGWL